MFDRNLMKALMLIGIALPFAGCTKQSGLDAIQVSPATASLAVGGPTLQMSATGTYGNAKDPSTQNLTGGVTWSSAIPGVAKVDPNSGVVTAVAAGTTTITASAQGFAGPVSSSATIIVTGGSTAGGDIISLTIIPTAQSVAAPPQTSQFVAIGTTTSGATENLTSQAVWTSSNAQVAPNPVNGLATAAGQGTTTITAIATNPDKTVATGTATFTVTTAATSQITAITILPASQSLSAEGQKGQFIALGTYGATGAQVDVTNSPQLTWSSSISSIASVTSGLTAGDGVAQGANVGTTTITAEYANTPAGSSVAASTATVSVTSSPAPEPLLSINVLPSTITDLDLLGTAQFLAYGTFSTQPFLLEITNGFSHPGFPVGCTANCPKVPVTWISTFPFGFPINATGASGAEGGLSTAYESGNTSIYALAANPDQTLVYSPIVTFNCPYAPPTYGTTTVTNANGTTTTTTNYNDLLNPGTCNQLTIADSLLTTLTVFNTGLNTSNWLITASSATGTPNVIHCGPGSTSGGSVCEATYPNGTQVTLTAPAQPGVQFGGWSSSCDSISPNPSTAAGPNTCTVMVGGGCTLNTATQTYTCSSQSNVSVGAIFN